MDAPEPHASTALSLAARTLRAIGAVLLRIPRGRAIVPVLLWAGLIFFMSSRPAPSLPGVGQFAGVLANFAHALEYGVFAVFLALLAPRAQGWVELRPRTALLILAGVLLYAASDEWHQSFTPHRDASVFDVLTDFTGASATLACIAALGRRDAGRAFGIAFALGLLASLAAAALATYGA